jgi:glycosyltransferase involved in cell wall biosynthesis
LIEAMSVGLSVIAPDLGGISEVVSSQTGQLIPNSPDDTTLISSYLIALSALYNNSVNVVDLRKNALELIRDSYGQEQFVMGVSELTSSTNICNAD